MQGQSIFGIGGILGAIVAVLTSILVLYKTNNVLKSIIVVICMFAVFFLGGALAADLVDPGWFFHEEPCANCGELVSEDANHCQKCGYAINQVCITCGERVEKTPTRLFPPKRGGLTVGFHGV